MQIVRDLCFFDTETTGTNTQTDRVVELSVTKIFKETGTRAVKTWRINPTIPIPKEASDVHGITDEMVKDCPTFLEVAAEIYHYFKDSDIAGFNHDNFDIPIMLAEFARCKYTFLVWEHNSIDVYLLHKKLNPQSLSDLFKLYTGNEMKNAHTADADNYATEVVLSHILDLKFTKETSTTELSNFIQGDKKRYDIAGKLYQNKDGIVCWNFGQHKDKPYDHDLGFLNWVLAKDFPEQTKQKLRELINR